MLKSVYDTDDDGIVDFAEALKTEVRNSTGATLHKGHIVRLSGSTGNLPNAVYAQANNDANSAQTFGVVKADIPNNSNGYVITLGQIADLDTRTTATNPFTSNTLADGDVIYLSPTTPGHITNVKPFAPQHIVYVGMVVRNPALWWALASIPFIGALNLGVSFYLAFRVALQKELMTALSLVSSRSLGSMTISDKTGATLLSSQEWVSPAS
jgi:hypothetical protein